MSILTSESVLADLRRYPLLTPEQITRVESAANHHAPGPGKIVQRILDKGWITPFQAEVLLGGKASGLVFGHYVLLSRLGEGGMGAVFKARHIRLGRIDALKVIRADKIASKVVARRFAREIQLTADLNHPHIIKALDAGQVGTQLYLATEYVVGEDLTATVRRDGPFSVADACLVIYQSALALRHIQESGLIHRDLKPSNIMREEKSRMVKVLDLGLSSSLRELPSEGSKEGMLTRDGVMLGTPDFMPPEQARNPHGVDIRADLYALGGTFFYLLTGRTPYEGSPIEKLLQHTTAPPPKLFLPRSPTPPALAAIVEKLMAKRPEDRFQNPQALIDSLLSLRPGATPIALNSGSAPAVGASPAVDDWQSQFDFLISNDPSASDSYAPPEPSPEARFQGQPSHPHWRRARWPLAGVATLILIVLGVLSVGRDRPSEQPGQEAAKAEEEPADELKELRKAVYASGGNRRELRRRVLELRARKPGSSEAAKAATLLRRLPSPLDRLAPVSDDAADAAVVRLNDSGPPVATMLFSPTDDRLWIARQGQAPEAWDPVTAKETGLWKGMNIDEDSAASIAPDGRTAIGSDPDGKLVVWQNEKIRVLDVGPGLSISAVAVSPEGKYAVVAPNGANEQLAKVSLDSGKVLSRLDHPTEGVEALAISPNGTLCLTIGPEQMIRTLSTVSGKLSQVLDAFPQEGKGPSGLFGPDGQRLYLVGASRTASRFGPKNPEPLVHYEVAPEKSNPFTSRVNSSGRATCIAVSADESSVAVGTLVGNLHVYSAATGKPTREFRFRQAIRSLAFSTHGRILAVALDDGSVLLLPIQG